MRYVRHLFFGCLVWVLSACAPQTTQFIKIQVWDRIPNIHLQMEPLASEILVQPGTRISVLGVIPASATSEEAQRTREEGSLFLKGLDNALALQSKQVFYYVDRSEWVGDPIAGESQKQESGLIQANHLDFLIRIELPIPPKKGFPGVTPLYDVKATLLDSNLQLVTRIHMRLSTYDFFLSTVSGTTKDGDWTPDQIGPLDKQAYYNEIGRLVARNLVKMLEPSMLHSSDREIKYLDQEAYRMFPEGLPRLPATKPADP